jgi:hypothetical protein
MNVTSLGPINENPEYNSLSKQPPVRRTSVDPKIRSIFEDCFSNNGNESLDDSIKILAERSKCDKKRNTDRLRKRFSIEISVSPNNPRRTPTLDQ